MTDDDKQELIAQIDRVIVLRRKNQFQQRELVAAQHKAAKTMNDLMEGEHQLDAILNRATYSVEETIA